MKNRRRHQKGGDFFEGFFPKGTTLDGIFFIKLSSSSFTILVGSSSLTYLMIAKVKGKCWDTSTTVVSCAAAASSSEDLTQMHHRGVPAPHVCNNLGTIQYYKKKGSNARYWWWTKSCTTKDDDYPTIHRILSIPGGAGFLPSTVSPGLLEDGLSCIHIRGISARWMWFPLSCF